MSLSYSNSLPHHAYDATTRDSALQMNEELLVSCTALSAGCVDEYGVKGTRLVRSEPMQESHTCHQPVLLGGKKVLICRLIEIPNVSVLRRVISINIGPSHDIDEIEAGNLGAPG